MTEEPPLRVAATIAGTGLTDASGTEFKSLVGTLGPIFIELARDAGVDRLKVECILADDFVAAVNARMRRFGDSDREGFTIERVGGVVVGKNLAQSEDDSMVAILFAPDVWTDALGGAAYRLALVSHEIAHSVLTRIRRMSGALDGIQFPSQTLTEIARSSARIDWDEFRAEGLADLVVKAITTVTTDAGGTRPARLADISLSAYRSQLLDQLSRAYPAWPDRVQAYREHRLGLNEMWTQTLRDVGQTRTAMAMMFGAMGLDSNDQAPDDIRSLPAYQLYFGSSWDAYISAIRAAPVIGTVAEHLEVERAILRTGELSFRGALFALGLTADDLPGRQAYVHVTEPRRI